MDKKAVSTLLGGAELRTDISIDELVITKPQPGVLVVSAENGRSLKFETSGIEESMADDWERMLEAALTTLNAQNAALNSVSQRLAQAELQNTVQLGLLPPLSLLVFGWSVLWALRGFRRDKS